MLSVSARLHGSNSQEREMRSDARAVLESRMKRVDDEKEARGDEL